jgi:hypothetical protein
MLMTSKPHPTSRKASLEIREELLNLLGAPVGSVTISRRPTDEGDVIVVRMLSSGAVPPSKRPQSYKGFKVDYQVTPAVKAGRW